MSDQENKDPVSMNVVYQEMYSEMRRHRDYELSAANWCTIILLAIIGGAFNVYKDNPALLCSFPLSTIIIIKILVSVLLLTVGTAGIVIVLYSSTRYKHMRDWVTYNLEPEEKNYRPRKVRIRLKDYIIVVLGVLSGCGIIFVWLL